MHSSGAIQILLIYTISYKIYEPGGQVDNKEPQRSQQMSSLTQGSHLKRCQIICNHKAVVGHIFAELQYGKSDSSLIV